MTGLIRHEHEQARYMPQVADPQNPASDGDRSASGRDVEVVAARRNPDRTAIGRPQAQDIFGDVVIIVGLVQCSRRYDDGLTILADAARSRRRLR